MADIFSTLSLGARALTAHRTAAATASHNLENASTPGYARQRANLEANEADAFSPTGFIGSGVRVAGISQARDRFVESRLPGLFASSSSSTARADALAAVTSFDPEGGVKLTSRMSSFFGSLRDLQQRPTDPATRRGAVAAADELARGFNAAANDLESARRAVDADLKSRAPQATQLLATVADLNVRIKVAAASGGGPPNDLIDARQRAVDAAVQLTGAVVIPNDDGDVGLALASGESLVAGDSAATINATTDAAGRLTFSVQRPGGAAHVVDNADWRGTFGGAFTARDQDLGGAAAALDAAADSFASAVNAAHSAGFALDGSTGRPLFSGSGARGIAVEATIKADPSLLQLSADPTRAGDAQNLVALLTVEQSNPAGALSDVVAIFGEAARAADVDAEADLGLLTHGLDLREGVSGVSVDEELVELQRAERAFQAATKVVSTADQMLQTLLDLKN